jgi:hypothetical protein
MPLALKSLLQNAAHRRVCRRAVFYGHVQGIELEQQMGAHVKDHGSRPLHERMDFAERIFGETTLSQVGSALIPEEECASELAGRNGLPN